MPPASFAAPTTLAEKLLSGWETQARPLRLPDYPVARASLLVHLTQFSGLLLHADDLNVDAEDVCAVLHDATAFRLSHAAAAGPGRASRLGSGLVAERPLFPPGAQATSLRPTAALLSLQSSPVHELEMDELTGIVESVQQTILTPDTEMIFGHGIMPEAEDAGLQAWLLVGYGTE